MAGWGTVPLSLVSQLIDLVSSVVLSLLALFVETAAQHVIRALLCCQTASVQLRKGRIEVGEVSLPGVSVSRASLCWASSGPPLKLTARGVRVQLPSASSSSSSTPSASLPVPSFIARYMSICIEDIEGFGGSADTVHLIHAANTSARVVIVRGVRGDVASVGYNAPTVSFVIEGIGTPSTTVSLLSGCAVVAGPSDVTAVPISRPERCTPGLCLHRYDGDVGMRQFKLLVHGEGEATVEGLCLHATRCEVGVDRVSVAPVGGLEVVCLRGMQVAVGERTVAVTVQQAELQYNLPFWQRVVDASPSFEGGEGSGREVRVECGAATVRFPSGVPGEEELVVRGERVTWEGQRVTVSHPVFGYMGRPVVSSEDVVVLIRDREVVVEVPARGEASLTPVALQYLVWHLGQGIAHLVFSPYCLSTVTASGRVVGPYLMGTPPSDPYDATVHFVPYARPRLVVNDTAVHVWPGNTTFTEDHGREVIVVALDPLTRVALHAPPAIVAAVREGLEVIGASLRQIGRPGRGRRTLVVLKQGVRGSFEGPDGTVVDLETPDEVVIEVTTSPTVNVTTVTTGQLTVGGDVVRAERTYLEWKLPKRVPDVPVADLHQHIALGCHGATDVRVDRDTFGVMLDAVLAHFPQMRGKGLDLRGMYPITDCDPVPRLSTVAFVCHGKCTVQLLAGGASHGVLRHRDGSLTFRYQNRDLLRWTADWKVGVQSLDHASLPSVISGGTVHLTYGACEPTPFTRETALPSPLNLEGVEFATMEEAEYTATLALTFTDTVWQYGHHPVQDIHKFFQVAWIWRNVTRPTPPWPTRPYNLRVTALRFLQNRFHLLAPRSPLAWGKEGLVATVAEAECGAQGFRTATPGGTALEWLCTISGIDLEGVGCVPSATVSLLVLWRDDVGPEPQRDGKWDMGIRTPPWMWYTAYLSPPPSPLRLSPQTLLDIGHIGVHNFASRGAVVPTVGMVDWSEWNRVWMGGTVEWEVVRVEVGHGTQARLEGVVVDFVGRTDYTKRTAVHVERVELETTDDDWLDAEQLDLTIMRSPTDNCWRIAAADIAVGSLCFPRFAEALRCVTATSMRLHSYRPPTTRHDMLLSEAKPLRVPDGCDTVVMDGCGGLLVLDSTEPTTSNTANPTLLIPCGVTLVLRNFLIIGAHPLDDYVGGGGTAVVDSPAPDSRRIPPEVEVDLRKVSLVSGPVEVALALTYPTLTATGVTVATRDGIIFGPSNVTTVGGVMELAGVVAAKLRPSDLAAVVSVVQSNRPTGWGARDSASGAGNAWPIAIPGGCQVALLDHQGHLIASGTATIDSGSLLLRATSFNPTTGHEVVIDTTIAITRDEHGTVCLSSPHRIEVTLTDRLLAHAVSFARTFVNELGNPTQPTGGFRSHSSRRMSCLIDGMPSYTTTIANRSGVLLAVVASDGAIVPLEDGEEKEVDTDRSTLRLALGGDEKRVAVSLRNGLGTPAVCISKGVLLKVEAGHRNIVLRSRFRVRNRCGELMEVEGLGGVPPHAVLPVPIPLLPLRSLTVKGYGTAVLPNEGVVHVEGSAGVLAVRVLSGEENMVDTAGDVFIDLRAPVKVVNHLPHPISATVGTSPTGEIPPGGSKDMFCSAAEVAVDGMPTEKEKVLLHHDDEEGEVIVHAKRWVVNKLSRDVVLQGVGSVPPGGTVVVGEAAVKTRKGWKAIDFSAQCAVLGDEVLVRTSHTGRTAVATLSSTHIVTNSTSHLITFDTVPIPPGNTIPAAVFGEALLGVGDVQATVSPTTLGGNTVEVAGRTFTCYTSQEDDIIYIDILEGSTPTLELCNASGKGVVVTVGTNPPIPLPPHAKVMTSLHITNPLPVSVDNGEVEELALGEGAYRVGRHTPYLVVGSNGKLVSPPVCEAPQGMKVLVTGSVGVSFILGLRELAYLASEDNEVEVRHGGGGWGLRWEVGRIQMDNSRHGALYPVALSTGTEVGEKYVAVRVFGVRTSPMLQAERVSVAIKELSVGVDTAFVKGWLQYLDPVKGLLLPKGRTRGERKVCIKSLELHPVKLTLSFQGDHADTSRSPEDDWEVANVAQAPLVFPVFAMAPVFATWKELQGAVAAHYRKHVLYQVYKVFFALEMLGNPVGLMGNIGDGLCDLFYEPVNAFNGENPTPLDIVKGVKKGAGSFVGNVAYGVTNAASGITGSLGRSIASLSLDDTFQKERQERAETHPRHIVEGIAGGAQSLAIGLGEGLSGIITKPVEGAREGGMGGLIQGVGRGLMGAVFKPVSGVLDMAAKTTEGMRNMVAVAAVRMRPPRVLVRGVVTPYNEEDAKAVIMAGAWKARYSTEHFMGFFTCSVAGDDHHYFFTHKHMLCFADGGKKQWGSKYDKLAEIKVPSEEKVTVAFHPTRRFLSKEKSPQGVHLSDMVQMEKVLDILGDRRPDIEVQQWVLHETASRKGGRIEVYENETYTPFFGWRPPQILLIRPHWSDARGLEPRDKQQKAPQGCQWTSEWSVGPWYYGADFADLHLDHRSTDLVRRRRWVRSFDPTPIPSAAPESESPTPS